VTVTPFLLFESVQSEVRSTFNLRNVVSSSGSGVVIFEIFSPKKSAKKLAGFDL
jgi:hypothetical protein